MLNLSNASLKFDHVTRQQCLVRFFTNATSPWSLSRSIILSDPLVFISSKLALTQSIIVHTKQYPTRILYRSKYNSSHDAPFWVQAADPPTTHSHRPVFPVPCFGKSLVSVFPPFPVAKKMATSDFSPVTTWKNRL